jgi:hypothetical protein
MSEVHGDLAPVPRACASSSLLSHLRFIRQVRASRRSARDGRDSRRPAIGRARAPRGRAHLQRWDGHGLGNRHGRNRWRCSGLHREGAVAPIWVRSGMAMDSRRPAVGRDRAPRGRAHLQRWDGHGLRNRQRGRKGIRFYPPGRGRASRHACVLSLLASTSVRNTQIPHGIDKYEHSSLVCQARRGGVPSPMCPGGASLVHGY